MNHIFLTGFMGAGKSTVGRILADILGLDIVDLDELIVQTEGMSINDMFNKNGENYFRDVESSVLNRIAVSDAKVVSTGGGCVGREENRDIMNSSGRTVYLETPWDIIVERLADCSERPLAASDNWNKTFALFEKRLPLYASADFTVHTSGKTPDAIAHEIADLVGP